MNKNGQFSHGRRVMNYALAAMEQMELYCEAHPGSPAAVRRPRLFIRGELWIALLGPNVEEGIVGIGPTVTAALRAFDAQYLAGLRPPAEAIGDYRPARSVSSASLVWLPDKTLSVFHNRRRMVTRTKWKRKES
jgi:hypothetical protein